MSTVPSVIRLSLYRRVAVTVCKVQEVLELAFSYSEVVILDLERLGKLRAEFLREKDPSQKQTKLNELLSLVQENWVHLVGQVAEENNPERLLALVTDLDQILEARRARRASSTNRSSELRAREKNRE